MTHLTDYGFYDYPDLIEKFLSKKITAHQFERLYLDNYLAEKVPMTEELFDELDWLFAKVDMYTDLPMGPQDKAENYINEDQLRKCAAESLTKIHDLEAQDNLKRTWPLGERPKK